MPAFGSRYFLGLEFVSILFQILVFVCHNAHWDFGMGKNCGGCL